MSTFTDIESEAPQKGAGEQLSELFSALIANSGRVMTPLAGVIVAALLVLVLGALYFQSWNALNEVNLQVNEARSSLAIPAPELPPLDEQLIAWESALSSAMDSRVEAPADSAFVQTILGATQDTGVTLVTASAQHDTTVQVDGQDYGASPYLIRVLGDLDEVQAFLRKLESGLVETLEVTTSVDTKDVTGFLVSIGVIVRNELPSGSDQAGESPDDNGSEGSLSVDARSGAGQ